MATNNVQDLTKYMQEKSKSLEGIKSGYGDIFTNYGNGLINNGAFQAIENARANANATTNRQYNDAAKNYYTQYKQNQMALPERLSNLGVTGGASETALLRLMNQYSGNLYNNENARKNAINQTNMQYDQQIADNSKAIAQQLASTYLDLALRARQELLEEQAAASYGYGGGYGDYYGGYGDYYDDDGYYWDEDSGLLNSFIPSTNTAKYNETYGTVTSKKSTVDKTKAKSSNVKSYTAPTKVYGRSVANGKRTATGGGRTVSNVPKKTTITRASGGGTSTGRNKNVKSYR